MNKRVLNRLNKLAELKVAAGIISIPQQDEFYIERRIPASKSVFAKRHGVKTGVVIETTPRRDLTAEDKQRKQFMEELQRLVDDLAIEHSTDGAADPLPPKYFLKQFEIEPKRLESARRRGAINAEKVGNGWRYYEDDVRRLWPGEFT